MIADGQHVDDVVRRMREHFRAQHPNKGFYETRMIEGVEQFNMSLDDWLTRNFGKDWAQRYSPQQMHNSVRQLLTAGNELYYSDALLKEANDYLEQNGLQQAAAAGNQNAQVPPVFFPRDNDPLPGNF